MTGSAKRTLFRLCFLLFTNDLLAQSNESVSGTGACGDDITARREFYEIRFYSYCGTKLTNDGVSSPVQRATFGDCSIACVEQGITCGGFAFDRYSHFSENNCYLNRASSVPLQTGTASENTWFDSAIVDNSSIPLTRRDCESIGADGAYRGYTLRCGEAIYDASSSSGNQLGTVFAASLSDCIDHCWNLQSDTGAFLCQAVTWDPSLIHGYQNCILKGDGYTEPTVDVSWDSAVLIGTEGVTVNDTSTGTSTSTTSQASSTSAGASTPSSSSQSQSSPTTAGASTPSSSSQSQSSPTTAPSKGLSGAQIAGIVAGTVGGFVILVGIVLFFWLRRGKSVPLPADHGVPVREITNPKPSGVLPVGAGTSKAVTKEGKGKERAVDVDEVVVAGPSRIRYA